MFCDKQGAVTSGDVLLDQHTHYHAQQLQLGMLSEILAQLIKMIQVMIEAALGWNNVTDRQYLSHSDILSEKSLQEL